MKSMQQLRKEFWHNFDEDLFFRFTLAKEERMNTYKIIYKYYKGSNTDAEMCQAIKYIQADDKQEAIARCDLWKPLIIKVEKV
tara:strand:- start:10923 stop:11171 length:249 start_codon:yes stop_codon:yes gene_type:complete